MVVDVGVDVEVDVMPFKTFGSRVETGHMFLGLWKTTAIYPVRSCSLF